MGKTLIRSKALDDFRFDGAFRIAVDGVYFYHSNKPHCEHCLRREHDDGRIDYFHYALVALLVAPNGLVIPLECEFIENTEEKGKPLSERYNMFKKQDDEHKAFKRLAQKLKTHYPRLSVCILGDALYCSGPVLKIIEDNRWDYFITIQDKCVRALQKKFNSDIKAHPDNRLCREINNVLYEYTWSNVVKHSFQQRKPKDEFWLFKINLKISAPGRKSSTFSYITNAKPSKQNIESLINEGGRQRWKIENQGFNFLKNHGMELEHGFGTTGHGLQNYFLIRLIALIITQLMIYSDMFRKLQAAETNTPKTMKSCWDFFKSFKNLASKLFISWVTELISLPDISKWRVRIDST